MEDEICPSTASSPSLLINALRPTTEPFPECLQPVLSFIALCAAKSAETRAAEVFFDALISSNGLTEDELRQSLRDTGIANDSRWAAPPPASSGAIPSSPQGSSHSTTAPQSLQKPKTSVHTALNPTSSPNTRTSNQKSAVPVPSHGPAKFPAIRGLLYTEVCVLVAIHYIRTTIRDLASMVEQSADISKPDQVASTRSPKSCPLPQTPSCSPAHTPSQRLSRVTDERRGSLELPEADADDKDVHHKKAVAHCYQVLSIQLRWIYCFLPDPQISALWHMVRSLREAWNNAEPSMPSGRPGPIRKRLRDEEVMTCGEDRHRVNVSSPGCMTAGGDAAMMPRLDIGMTDRPVTSAVITRSAMRVVEKEVLRVIESIQSELLMETHQLSCRASTIKLEFSLP